MGGFTPAGLGVVVAVCLMLATRPAFWNLDADRAPEAVARFLLISARTFLFALPMYLMVVKVELLTAGARPLVRIAGLAGAVLLGAAAYSTTALVLGLGHWHWQLAFFLRALAVGGLLTAIMYFAARERDARRELHRARLARVEIEQQATESRLRLLQAQLEPHFLFNALASIKRLYEKEPGGGRSMLRDLDDYVKVATTQARLLETPLAGEVALAESFLAIFKVRMGSRLRVRISMPGNVMSALVPPLMVGTLVENAIKHGIAPRSTGGTVSILARLEGETVEIDVQDDGVGFRARSGAGVGLANIRARLDTLFAGRGGLELASNAQGGVTATLRLPCRFAPRGAPA
jgi:sensor histidine kinase YesM